MNPLMKRTIVLALAVLAGTFPHAVWGQTVDRSSAQTSGFGFGARALGMGGAFIAIADDASAISWNPGGLGQLLDRQVTLAGSVNSFETADSRNQSLVDSFANGRIRVLTDDTAFQGSEAGLDFAAVVLPLSLGSRSLVLSLSYLRDQRAIHGNQSLTHRFFTAPTGDNLERPSLLQEVNVVSTGAGGLESYALGAATSFGDLSVGAGLSLHTGDIQLAREERVRITSLVDENGEPRSGIESDYLTSEGSRWNVSGYSLNVGVLWKATPWLSLGAVYRGGWSSEEPYEVTYRMTGYDRTLIPDGRYFDVALSATEPAKVRFPDAFGGGFAIRPIPPFTLAFDVTWTRWSEGAITNLPFVVRAGPRPECPPSCLEAVVADISYPSEALASADLQRDQLALRFGAEYVFRPGRLIFPLRAGVYRLPSIAPLYADRISEAGRSFDTDPETDFVGMTAGIGIVMPIGTSSRLLFDVAGIIERADSGWRQRESLDTTPAEISLSSTSDRSVTNRRLVASLIIYF